MSAIPKIDLAWEAINALGGASYSNCPREHGYLEAIGLALAEIEKLGGKDPLPQRSREKSGE